MIEVETCNMIMDEFSPALVDALDHEMNENRVPSST